MPNARRGNTTCIQCGAEGRLHLGVRLLCDRCFDREIARRTGWPELPDPPRIEELTGPDRRKHRMRYRLWRSPGGIVAEAEEINRMGNLKLEGYHFKLVAPRKRTAIGLSVSFGPDCIEKSRANTWSTTGMADPGYWQTRMSEVV